MSEQKLPVVEPEVPNPPVQVSTSAVRLIATLAVAGAVAGLAIVLVFLPLAWAVRRSWFYRRAVLLGGSLLIAALAGVWLAERMLEVKLLPW